MMIIHGLLVPFVPPLFLICTFLALVFFFSGSNLAYPQVINTNNTESLQNLSVKITSPKENQTIPIGELIVYGTSTDTLETNCQVFVDWNDVKPMQNVTGIGSGGKNDFSKWMFKYDNNYHLITEGPNELTSKISCPDNTNISNLASKYYTVNVTGSTDLTATTVPASDAGGQTIDNLTNGFNRTGSFSILPQYVATSSNNSQGDNEYQLDASNSDDSGEKFVIDVKNNSKSDKSQSIDHLLSMKIEGSSDGADKFLLKLHGGNSDSDSDATFKHRDLNKYIRSIIKEKLERVSERLLD